MRLGARFETPVKIDEATSLVSRGLFARICVEVDLSKPLLSKFQLRRRIRRVEYEGIFLVCFDWGKSGLPKELCPEGCSSPQPNTYVPCPGDAVQPLSESNPDFGKEGVAPIRAEIVDSYGPWMLAPKRVRRPSKQSARHDLEDKGVGKGKAMSHREPTTMCGKSTRYEALAAGVGERADPKLVTEDIIDSSLNEILVGTSKKERPMGGRVRKLG